MTTITLDAHTAIMLLSAATIPPNVIYIKERPLGTWGGGTGARNFGKTPSTGITAYDLGWRQCRRCTPMIMVLSNPPLARCPRCNTVMRSSTRHHANRDYPRN